MQNTGRRVETLSNQYPDAERVGDHIVLDKSEWCPGKHPEPHLRDEHQVGYVESYYRCIRCGVEVMRTRDLPDECEGDKQ